ncbi:MAG TPA: potassium transporter Kup [Acidimicrobiia bacterium]|nr:potassium transporter Kup [Acidimicrobiia bacterium]
MTATHRGRPTAMGGVAGLTLAALGIVYGDIGTSPLYSLRETFAARYGISVSEVSVLGSLSLIFWALILVITIKYVVVVMRADNDGEGGILSLTALVAPSDRERRRRSGLVMAGMFGAALLTGEGAITPSISVLAAVEGLQLVTPELTTFVIPISIAILIGLFAIQQRGTEVVGRLFGPLMLVWFAVLAVLGAVQIAANPTVLAALNPVHAIRFFAEYQGRAFVALGSIVLVVTGGEALYADLGHFGTRPIRLGWLGVVLPALVINYLGQGALLLAEPTAVESPFFLLAPSWALVPLVALATLATIVASQALISGVFSLVTQAMQLGFVPRLLVKHTSEDVHGQVYLPAVNWSLLIVCIGLVLGFRSSTNLAAAYGVAVTATMLITSILVSVYARERWDWGWGRVVSIIGLFALIDLAFLSSNLLKIPEGGWFALLAAGSVFFLMTTWVKGRRLVALRSGLGRQPLDKFIASLAKSPIQRTKGTAVYFFPVPGVVPPAFIANLRHNDAVHESVVFLSVVVSKKPRVPAARRDSVRHLGSRFFQVILEYGFMEEPEIPSALNHLIAEVAFDPLHTTYFLGKERVVSKEGVGLWGLRERLFYFLHRNARSAAEYFRLPFDRVVDIGVVVEI